MNPPLLLTGSLHAKSRLTQAALLALFIGLGALAFFQARLLLRWAGASSSPAGITAQAMQSRLNDVTLGLMEYLQDHDPQSLGRIRAGGKEANHLLHQFKEETRDSGGAYGRVEKAHERVRAATVALLEADQAETQSARASGEAGQALLVLLSDRIRPSIKPSQLYASAKLRAVLEAVAEAQALSKYASNPREAAPAEERFRQAMTTFERLSRSRRSSRWAEEARNLFDRGASMARKIGLAEKEKRAALVAYQEARRELDLALAIRSTGGAFSSGLSLVSLAGLLVALGVALIVGSGRHAERRLIDPLQGILQCVEAAAAGDLSRMPVFWSRDEVGQLAQAVGRLISVLARSESLVYHLAALVESTGEAIISHTLDGTILSWNKGAQRIYGYSAEEVKGRSIAILSPENGDAGMMEIVERVKRGERIQPFETVHRAKNGRGVRALVRVAAILDSTRKIIGASFCAQDLTDAHLLKAKSSQTGSVA